MYGDTNNHLEIQRSVELKNLYADFSQSKDGYSNESILKGKVWHKGLFRNMDQLQGLGGDILSQFKYERGSLNLSKQSINILGALSQASM